MSDDNEVTCDYMVPMTVRVNIETGVVNEIWLHLESFQSSPRGWFTQPGKDGKPDLTVTFRQAFDEGEFADGESERGDKALAIADRVTLHPNDVELELKGWTLDPPYQGE